VGTLEAAVRGGVRPLVEDGVNRAGGDRRDEVGVETDALGAGDAVGGPGVPEVGAVGEVVTGGDVVVTGGHDMAVAGRCLPDQLGDRGRHIGTPGDREAATLTEVVLHIYD